MAGAPIFSHLLHLNAARRLRGERVRAGLLAFDVIIAGWGLLWVFAVETQVENCFSFFWLSAASRVQPAHEDHPADHPRLSGCARPLGTWSTCFQPPPKLFIFYISCVFQSGFSLTLARWAAGAEFLGVVCCFIPQSSRLRLRGQASK